MSFWIENHKGKYVVGDFTAGHLRELLKVSGPKMSEFLNGGIANKELIDEIVEELEKKKNPGVDEKDILKALRRIDDWDAWVRLNG